MLEQWPFLLIGGIMLVCFFVLSFSSYKAKLPAVPSLIVFGISLGGFFVGEAKVLDYVAEIGIVLLFFLLGLEFPLNKMMKISKRVWPAGFLDLVLNLGVGLIIARLFGLSWLEAFVVGSVAYATSSSITIKLLEEKKRLASSDAEFMLALLIFEDLVAPILASIVASLYLGGVVSVDGLGLLAVKTVVLIGIGIMIGHFGFRKIGGFIESHYEEDFMPLFAVGIAFAYAGIAVVFGLSEVLGAFLAGMMLSETGRSHELDAIILPIRNLFLPFFFFWFGTTISFSGGLPLPLLLVALTLWSIIGKLLVGYVGGKIFGLSPVSALRSGFSLGQRGEFSVIIAALATTTIRTFSGIYILSTAIVGIVMFHNAGKWTKLIFSRRKPVSLAEKR